VASRFYRWRRDGVFQRLLAEVHRRADACGELDSHVSSTAIEWTSPKGAALS
jgi:hypothetical protein